MTRTLVWTFVAGAVLLALAIWLFGGSVMDNLGHDAAQLMP